MHTLGRSPIAALCVLGVFGWAVPAAVQVSTPVTPIRGGAADWPMFHFDPARTGRNPNEHVLNSSNVWELNEVWTFEAGGPVRSSPAMVDGVVYVGSHDGNLYALDAATGSLRWSFPTAGAVRSSPAVVDGVVYVTSWDGNAYAVDAATGQERWRSSIGGLADSSPVVANGIVYVASSDLYALDAATGVELWNFQTSFAAPPAP